MHVSWDKMGKQQLRLLLSIKQTAQFPVLIERKGKKDKNKNGQGRHQEMEKKNSGPAWFVFADWEVGVHDCRVRPAEVTS